MVVLALSLADLERASIPHTLHLFQGPFPTCSQLLNARRPPLARCHQLRLGLRVAPGSPKDLPTMPHPFVLGMRSPSFSHSQPHITPIHPSQTRYALYRLCPSSKPFSNPPSGIWACGGGTNVRAFQESSRVWKQHGRERYRTGWGGSSDRSGIHGWGQLCLAPAARLKKMQDSTHRDLVGVVADDEAPVADETVGPPVPLALFPLVRVIGKPLRQ